MRILSSLQIRFSKSQLGTSGGFLLLDSLSGLMVWAFGVLLIATAIYQSRIVEQSVNLIAARSEINLEIRRALMDRRALKEQTFSKNAVLKAVVNSDYTGPVTSIASYQLYGIDIYDGSGRKIAGAQVASGIDNTYSTQPGPVYYTTEGDICTNYGVGHCMISVSAVFSIQGNPTWGKIDPEPSYPSWDPRMRPDFMQISYTINFHPLLSGIARKDINGSMFLAFEDIKEMQGTVP